MKKTILVQKLIILIFLFLYASIVASAQVGIGTSNPKGILDITSTTQGVVYPRIALTSTISKAPVVNPQTGSIVAGTAVFNISSTSNGTNDVFPGIYVWNGSKWIPQFSKKHFEYFVQTATLRSSSTVLLPLDGYEDVPGLGIGDGKSIKARYSGKYKIVLKGNFGAGKINTGSGGKVNVAPQQGNFRFRFNGTDNFFGVKSFSTYSTEAVSGGVDFLNNIAQFSKTIYVDLVAGTTYAFSLTFDQLPAPGFVGNGNISIIPPGDGRGYVNVEVPCYIEFTYLDE